MCLCIAVYLAQAFPQNQGYLVKFECQKDLGCNFKSMPVYSNACKLVIVFIP